MPGHAKHVRHEARQRLRPHYGIRENDGGNACVESADSDTVHDKLLQAA